MSRTRLFYKNVFIPSGTQFELERTCKGCASEFRIQKTAGQLSSDSKQLRAFYVHLVNCSEYLNAYEVRECLECMVVVLKEDWEQHLLAEHRVSCAENTANGCDDVKQQQISDRRKNTLVRIPRPKKLDSHRKEIEQHFSIFKVDRICDFCGKHFYRETSFLIHTPCYLVNKKKQNLKQGLPAQHNLFACEICGNDFGLTHFSLDNLKKHMLSHFTPIYTCKTCQHKFYTASSALRHLRSHLKIKPHVCTFDGCSKAFTQPNDLATHITNIHEKRKSHTCTQCGKGFCSASSLATHANRYHKQIFNSPCQVAGCGRAFVKKSNLQAHMRVAHSDVPFNYAEYLRKYKVDRKKISKIRAVITEDGAVQKIKAEKA